MGKHRRDEELEDINNLEKKLIASLDSIKAEIAVRHQNGESELVDELEIRKKEIKRKIKAVRQMKKRYQTSKYSLRGGDHTMKPVRVPGGIQGAGTKRKKQ